MTNQIDIIKEIADGMVGIGGVPNNEEFYAKFDSRVRSALNIDDTKSSLLLSGKLALEARLVTTAKPD